MAHTAANDVVGNPRILEVFTAAVTVSAVPITVKKVVLVSATIADRFALVTKEATDATKTRVVIDLQMSTNTGMEEIDFGDKGQTFESLYFDHDIINTGLGAGDRVLIYLV